MQVDAALALLKQHASTEVRDGMSRFGIPSTYALGVSVKDIRSVAKPVGKDQALAEALWKTGVYEARVLTSLVAEPARVSSEQMDEWCAEFDNWAICDAMCLNLFARTDHAWEKVRAWTDREEEFVKRAGFALLWSLSVHARKAADSLFVEGLALIEREANDERHYVSKAINMALRAVGKRRAALRSACVETAERLAASKSKPAQWVGRDALREWSARGARQGS